MIDNTTQRECVTTATIKMAEPKSHGSALMINSMPTVTVRIVTSTCTTKWKEKSPAILTLWKNSKASNSTLNLKLKTHNETYVIQN